MSTDIPVSPPSPNSAGPRDDKQTYRLPEAIYKPLGSGSLDDRGRDTTSTHKAMPNKVLPTARPAPPAREAPNAPARKPLGSPRR
jgi:hypothetical protein